MSDNKYQHKLPDWEPCNAIGRAIKRLEESGTIGIKYPLPETDKHAVVFDESEHGMWTELLAAYSEKSAVGIVANKSTTILNNPELDWEYAKGLCKWLCEEQQYTIDYAKTGTPLEMDPEVKKEIEKGLNAKLPNYMRVVKANEDKKKLDENNWIVREAAANGHKTNRKHQTKADYDAKYEDEPNPNRTMGKIWLEVDRWCKENIPDGVDNIYIKDQQCLAAPETCSDEVRAELANAAKYSNTNRKTYNARLSLPTALKPTEETYEVAHMFYDKFKFEDLLDVALNTPNGKNAMAAILLLHKDKFMDYLQTPSAQVLRPGDYWTPDGENGWKTRRKKSVSAAGHTTNATKAKEVPILLVKEDGEVVKQYDSLTKCSEEINIGKNNISTYIKDGKFHKVKSLGFKCKFIKAE